MLDTEKEPATAAATPASVIEEIAQQQAVYDGEKWVPLHSHVSTSDGAFLQRLIGDIDAASTLEVGMAYGLSTLFICGALLPKGARAHHIAIDPFQTQDWQGIGLANVRRANCAHLVEFHEERSEFVLPRLAAEGRQLDFAFIDGWHNFEQALVEFYYLDRMLRVGGIVAFDDSDWPSINKVLRYLVRLPGYRVHPAPAAGGPPTALGKLRSVLSNTGIGQRVLHPTFRQRNWDLGLTGRCVALKKVAVDERPMTWFADF
jgi:predicted O-methyltransferase YrrM